MSSGWYTAADCARELKHTVGWFYKNYKALRERGFPDKDPRVIGHPRWVTAEVDAFVTANVERHTVGELAAATDDTDALADELAERARAIGRSFIKGESADA